MSDASHDDEKGEARRPAQVVRLVLVGLAVMLSWLRIWHLFLPIDLIAIVCSISGRLSSLQGNFPST